MPSGPLSIIVKSICTDTDYFSLVLILATFPSFLVLLLAFLFLEKLLQRLVLALVPKTSELHAGISCSAGTLRELVPRLIWYLTCRSRQQLVAYEQALVHSGLDIDLLSYEQVLVQEVITSESVRCVCRHACFCCVSKGLTCSHLVSDIQSESLQLHTCKGTG